MKRLLAVILAVLFVLPCFGAFSVSAAPNEWKSIWVTHFNTSSGEGAGAIITKQDANIINAWAWRIIVVFAPVEDIPGVYEVRGIYDHLDKGQENATVTEAFNNSAIPDGGFIYTLNYGNDYTASGGENFINTNCSNAIEDVKTWKVGDLFEFTHLNLESLAVPTITPKTNWYDSSYVCTSKYRVYKEEAREATESIALDGVLDDNCWLDYNWTSVDGNSGHWQKSFNDKSLAFKYQFRTDNTYLYGAAEIFNTPVAGTGNGSATNFRLWINTNSESEGATHYYDIFYSVNGGAGITPSVAGSAMTAALTTTSSSVRMEFRVPLAEIGATAHSQIPYFISCSTNNGSEEPCLYYPKVYTDPGVTFYPKNAWYRGNDGDLNVYALRLNGFEFTLSADGTYYILSGINGAVPQQLVLPSSHAGLPVKEVGRLAFSESNITALVIPDSVTTIAHGAFGECKLLTSVTLGKNVQDIGMMAFIGCESLSYVSLPDSLKSIGNVAFSSCALETVTIPSSVEKVGSNAFAFCNDLTDIYCAPASKPAGWSDVWTGNCDATVHWTNSAHSFETIWSCDDNYHWRECTHCDEAIIDKTEHIPGDIDPVTNQSLCIVCGTPLGGSAPVDPPVDPETKTYALGDINMDGTVNQYDYILAKRAHFDTITFNESQKVLGDMDENGVNNQYDYILVKRIHFKNYSTDKTVEIVVG